MQVSESNDVSRIENLFSDLRGVNGITINAITGVVDLVESLHRTIARGAGPLSVTDDHRTKGITGLVYHNVRTITKAVGFAIDLPLKGLGSMVTTDRSLAGREASVAAINGLIGDHLAAENNPLAIPMQFRRHGQELEAHTWPDLVRQSNGRIAILIHGAFMNDLQWARKGHDHGAALARDLGLTPIYLRYNTGRHISENGRQLAQLLESFMQQAAQPLELYLITHSMGGLVARSACYYGQAEDHAWLQQLNKLVFLGTPHHGAPLEKNGNWINVVLDQSPYSAPFARLGKIRSSGITDLRNGTLIDDDWLGTDRFRAFGERPTPVPLPENVACYTIATTVQRDSSFVGDRLIGDGLVPLSSALGQHRDASRQLFFPDSHVWIGRNINHFELLNHPAVYETLKWWISS